MYDTCSYIKQKASGNSIAHDSYFLLLKIERQTDRQTEKRV